MQDLIEKLQNKELCIVENCGKHRITDGTRNAPLTEEQADKFKRFIVQPDGDTERSEQDFKQ